MQNSSKWWSGDPQKRLNERIESIQQINDPNTSADEMLRVGKWLFALLLAYSGVLSTMSYYHNFSRSFGFEIGVFLAVALATTIEVSKSYFGKWAVRIPTFMGGRYLTASAVQSFRWIAMTAVAVAAFIMSVFNSTAGGKQLGSILRHEREATSFIADTKVIDEQIAGVQNTINANMGVTYKGTQTYQAQKSNVTLSRSLEKLQADRQKAIDTQRADWEKSEGRKESDNQYGAALIMASGGWVEFLQFAIMFFIVMNERTLLRRTDPVPTPTPTTTPTPNTSRQPETLHPKPEPLASIFGKNFIDNTSRQLIGFYQNPNPVSQSDTSVTARSPELITKTTEEAFLHYLSKFKGDVANLRNGNGYRNTICDRLQSAAEGMLQHSKALSPEKADKVIEYIRDFYTVHESLVKEYTTEDLRSTPLIKYHEPISLLYQRLMLQKQPV